MLAAIAARSTEARARSIGSKLRKPPARRRRGGRRQRSRRKLNAVFFILVPDAGVGSTQARSFNPVPDPNAACRCTPEGRGGGDVLYALPQQHRRSALPVDPPLRYLSRRRLLSPSTSYLCDGGAVPPPSSAVRSLCDGGAVPPPSSAVLGVLRLQFFHCRARRSRRDPGWA